MFWLVNIKGLQREQEVPRYTKCICDDQKDRECTFNGRIESFDFTKSVYKLPI